MIGEINLWACQYLLGAIISLIVSFYVYNLNKKHLANITFLLLGFLLFLWNIFIFLHRNASTAEYSLLFFKLSEVFVICFTPMITILLLNIKKPQTKNFIIIIPVFIITTAVVLFGGITIIPTENYGWSYHPDSAHSILLSLIIPYNLVFLYLAVKYLREKSSSILKKKVFLFFIGMIFYAISIVTANYFIAKDPNFPPFGGLLTTITFIIFGYSITLKEEMKISESDDHDIFDKNLLEFLKKIYDHMPGSELGSKETEFKRYLLNMNLNKYFTVEDGIIKTSGESISPEDMHQVMIETIKILTNERWAKPILDEAVEFFAEAYDKYQDKSLFEGCVASRSVKNIIDLAQMQINLKIQNEILDKTNQDLKQNIEKAEFYNDLMSHDITNINQGLHGFLEILSKDKTLAENQRKYINVALNQAKRTSNLISNLKMLDNLENGNKLHYTDLDLTEIIQKSIEDLKATYDRTIRINFDNQIKRPIYASELLKHVFDNILLNAAKYDMHDPLEIDILVEDEETNYKITVTDSGIGVHDNNKQMIFNRFKRESEKIPGSGLGLSIVKKLVETHDGKVWIEDRVKGDYTKGAKIIVLLPKNPQNKKSI